MVLFFSQKCVLKNDAVFLQRCVLKNDAVFFTEGFKKMVLFFYRGF